MISKIIILAIALGITVPVALEKGIQDTMNDPKAIKEYQEYEEYAKQTIDEELHGDEIIEKFEYILDKYDGSIDVQEGEIEAYLEENDIPYEKSKVKPYDVEQVVIYAEKHGILLQLSYDVDGMFNPFSHWERCTHSYEPCLQLNINN